MKTFLTAILITFNSCFVFSQNFKKVVFDKSLSDGYYLIVEPESPDVNGVIVLLPGFSQKAESIFPQTKIHNVAYTNNLAIVAIAGGSKIYADEQVISKLDDALNNVKSKYKIPKNKFIIGGFSAGGTISLGYTEYCNKKPHVASIHPQGVFSVDSPVDLFDLWKYLQREIKKDYSDAGTNEANYVSKIMQEEIGTPEENKDVYERLTPFYAGSEKTGNEKNLVDIAVRVYHDIDVSWQIDNRRRSLFDSNALAASELINRLRLLGNEKAEFMIAQQPGYRSEGFRHPHSWSIVNEVDLIKWANRILEN